MLVVLLLLLLSNVQSLIEDLAHPESALNFVAFAVIPLTLVLLGAIASISVLRSRSDDGAPAVAYAAAGIIIVSGLVGIVSALGLEDDTAAAGDLQIVAEEAEFSTSSLNGSGTIGIFVDNQDPVRHTFTIKALDVDVDVELPANTARRVDVTGPAGEYEFLCTVPGHEKIKGTLTIGS